MIASNNTEQRPDIRLLEIRSDVRFRFARTEVFSKIANPADEPQEVTFKTILPDAAFVSSFSITVGGQVYPARVEDREEAHVEYEAAVRAGRTAGHVQMSARRANLLAVALHVAARDEVAFNLTYEQLLSRERGLYRLRFMLDPGQPVQRLLVEARLRDAAKLTLVRVASLRANDYEVDDQEPGHVEPEDPLATVKRIAPEEALVQWEPDEAAQNNLAGSDGNGLRGLLEVQYDVERSVGASELVVGNDGYFVHFFSPPEEELQPLPKHVVFLLDVSGSMHGRKIEQLQEAMAAILSELRVADTFSMLTFSSYTSLWTPSENFRHVSARQDGWAEAVVTVSAANITAAQNAVRSIDAGGSTHMYEALKLAFALANDGDREEQQGQGRRQPLVFFLTDGEPNGPNCSHGELEELVGGAAGRATLYSLAFGRGADFAFLKRLSLRARGFARKIYEAADAALQLRNFYRSVASPLLSNVTFRYADDEVEQSTLTQSEFPLHLSGAELVVAGLLNLALRGRVQRCAAPWEVVHEEVGAEEEEEEEEEEVVLQATVEGDGAGAERLISPARVARPSEAPFMERLWAYLTVRQLLERAHGDDAEARKRARQLALQYSFVTPLTSLIVVKPGNQTASADLRDVDDAAADATSNIHNYDSDRFVKRSLCYRASSHSSNRSLLPRMSAPPRAMMSLSYCCSIDSSSNLKKSPPVLAADSSLDKKKKSFFRIFASKKEKTFTVIVEGKPLATVKANLIDAFHSIPELSHSEINSMSFHVEYKLSSAAPAVFQRQMRFQVDVAAVSKPPGTPAPTTLSPLAPHDESKENLYAVTFTLLSGGIEHFRRICGRIQTLICSRPPSPHSESDPEQNSAKSAHEGPITVSP